MGRRSIPDLWTGVTSIHIGMYLLVTPSTYTGKDLVNYNVQIIVVRNISAFAGVHDVAI